MQERVQEGFAAFPLNASDAVAHASTAHGYGGADPNSPTASAALWAAFLQEHGIHSDGDTAAVRAVVISAVRAAVMDGVLNAARMAQLLRRVAGVVCGEDLEN